MYYILYTTPNKNMSMSMSMSYIPVLTTPRDFVEEIFGKPSEGFPVALYIAIVP